MFVTITLNLYIGIMHFLLQVTKVCPKPLLRFKPIIGTHLGNYVRNKYIERLHFSDLFLRCYCSNKESDPLWPLIKTWNILKSESKDLIKVIDGIPLDERPEDSIPQECDILIVGGGVIGSSIAYWLKQRAFDGLQVVVVEKDCSVIDNRTSYNYDKYNNAATTLSCGGIRQQFSLKENIEMSLYSAEFLRNIEHHLGYDGCEKIDVQFSPQGYLFLSSEKSAHILEENSKFQQSLGAKNELLTPNQMKHNWPWLNVDNIKLGCHGLENEGWFDPWSLLTAFKNKAQFLGTRYIDGEVTGFSFQNRNDVVMESTPFGSYTGVNEASIKLKNGYEGKIQFSQLIIAAGANSGAVGKLCRMGEGSRFLQYPVPVEPRKRYVYCVHCPGGPGIKAPFVIDPSGMYFRREGTGDNYICGLSPDPEEEPACDNYDVDYNFFDEKVWPLLAKRVPAFESLKMKSGWAGFYDFNTFDENAIIGPHPAYMNVYLATGFSGHGLQQAPAVGRAIMELIVDGRYVTIDLTNMQFERIVYQEYLLETNII